MTTRPSFSTAHPDSMYLVAQSVPRGDERQRAVILVATDASERSDGALRIGLARATATGATLEVITVIPTESFVASDIIPQEESLELLRRTARCRLVEEQVARVLGREHAISITVLEGNPAYTISRIAIERRAALLVVGIGRHFVAQRLFSDETALLLARIARVPILAVPADATSTPRSAIVAIDFSEISTRAAQTAVDAMDDGGHVTLVHVLTNTSDDALSRAAREPNEQWSDAQLAILAADLVVRADVGVSWLTRRGHAHTEVLALAKETGADLIVTGTHGRGFIARTILGSVTTQLLRAATCTLLAVPRDPLPAITPSVQEASARSALEAPHAWGRMLNEFTQRNSGRRTILEVDDTGNREQAQEYNYPLLACSYSERDARLELMLGDQHADGLRITRSIGAIAAIDVLTDGAGRDIALRVQHGTSQTLLTFAA